MIHARQLEQAFAVRAGFTGRDLAAPLPSAGQEAQMAPILERLGMPGARAGVVEQVHGDRVLCARRGHPLWPVGQADALICDEPGLVVAVRTADCVPILLAGPGAVAAVHAGWRGTAAGIARKAAVALARHCGCRPTQLRAALGPAIGACCYEVGPEVLERLHALAPAQVWRSEVKDHALAASHAHADLRAVNLWLLQRLGLASVSALPTCTCCDPAYHSYRRDGPRAGRQLALIGLLS